MATIKRYTRVSALGLSLCLSAIGCGGAPAENPDPTQSPGLSTPTPATGQEASLELGDVEIDFGTVVAGSRVQETTVISNTGDVSVTLLDTEVTGRNGDWFSVSGLGAIAPGADLTITVTFEPEGEEAASGSIGFVSSPDAGVLTLRTLGVGGCQDGDGDGACGDDDCDDSDNDVYVDADEVCDGKDNDCDGQVDNNPEDGTQWYKDVDGDGYGDESGRPTISCEEPLGRDWIDEGGDCDDTNPAINEGAAEICDSLDNDCDRRADEGDAEGDGTYDCLDDDGDGYCEGESCSGSALPGDCDDTEGSASPDLEEIPLDGIDNNCNGIVDENSLPTVSFISPTLESPAQAIPGESLTLQVEVGDAEDGLALTVTITSSIDGEVCQGAASSSDGVYICDATLSYGRHTLTASVTDSEGETITDEATAILGNAPVLNPVYPFEDALIPFGVSKTFNVGVTDLDEEDTPSEFVWRSDVVGVLAQGIVEDRSAFAPVTLLVEGDHVLTFTVTDSLGLVSSFDLNITVSEADCSTTRDLVALYHFNEGGGVSAEDASGNGLHAEVSSDWTAGGKFEGGVDFDGSDSFIKVANAGDALDLQRFTIEAWVQFTSPPVPPQVVRQPIFQKLVTDGGTLDNFDMRLNPTGLPQISVDQSTTIPPGQSAIGSATVSRDTWYLMSATYDGSSLKIFVNGTLDGENEIGEVTLQTGAGALYLGTDRFSGAQAPASLNGVMDEVRILGCALLDEQIRADYRLDAAFPGPELEPTPTPTEETPTPDDAGGDETPTNTPE